MRKKYLVVAVSLMAIFLAIPMRGGLQAMAEHNIQITQRNANNTELDLLYPMTKAANVITASGSNVETKLAISASELATLLDYSPIGKPNLQNNNAHQLFRGARNKTLSDVNYIMVGDSTRASNGAYIFSEVSAVLSGINVFAILSAQSGLKAEHWGSSGDTVQPGYIQAVDLIANIPGTGATTVVDICLGINDLAHTAEEVLGYIQAGINIIKAQKPNTLFICTSPNFLERTGTQNETLRQIYDTLWDAGYGKCDVSRNVFRSDADMTGFFLDTTHPNELGQRKMADFILKQLIPEDLRLSGLITERVLIGQLTSSTTNNPIRACGIRCELKYASGMPTGNLYVHKLANGFVYLFDATSGDSVSGSIPLTAGEHSVGNGYKAGVTTSSLVYIDDPAPLQALTDYATYFPVVNGVVTNFSVRMSPMDHIKRLYALAIKALE